MIYKVRNYIQFVLILLAISCSKDKNKKKRSGTNSNSLSVEILHKDTMRLKETFNEDDVPLNGYLEKQLKPIRENFKRINSITIWSNIVVKEIRKNKNYEVVKYYYKNGHLEKIISRQFEGSLYQLTEYYLMNKQLSFVFEKSYQANKSNDSSKVVNREITDTAEIDIENNEILESKNYFEAGKLLHQSNSQDCGSPFTADYLNEEQKRIERDFLRFIKMQLVR